MSQKAHLGRNILGWALLERRSGEGDQKVDMIRAALRVLSDAKRKAAILRWRDPERFGPRSVREVAAGGEVSPSQLYPPFPIAWALPILRLLRPRWVRASFARQSKRVICKHALPWAKSMVCMRRFWRRPRGTTEALKSIQTAELKQAAALINRASKVYVLGVGIANVRGKILLI